MKIKRKYLVKKSFADTYVYKYFLIYFYPRGNTKLYSYYQKLISKSMIYTSVQNLWNIKMLFAIAALVITLLVTKTNIYYQSAELVNTSQSDTSDAFTGSIDDQETLKKQADEAELEKKIFEQVSGKFDFEELKKDESAAIIKLSEYIELNNLASKDIATDELARNVYKKLDKYYSLQQVDYLGLIIIIVFSFFIPDAYLMFKGFMLKYLIYNEYLKLEVTTIMVGKLEPIKVEEILNVLSDNSKYFKRYIDEIRYNYFNVKDGNSRAFDAVIAKVGHKELKYLLKALQQAAESDLKMTIENLENQRKSNKEFRSIKEQSKLKKKELVGILVILIILAGICVYAFAPFEQIMNNFSI